MTQTPNQPQTQRGDAVAIKKGGMASVMSGAMSGALISMCVQPLDVIKTRMQADAARGVATSAVATLRTVVADSGIRALWQGTQPTVIRLSLGAGMHFFLLERMKAVFLSRKSKPVAFLTNPNPKPTSSTPPLASSSLSSLPPLAAAGPSLTASEAAIVGGASRALASALLCPFTLVKTRMELGSAGQHAYRNTFDAMVTIVRTERVSGLFRGMVPNILANAPFSAIYYVGYTQLQERLGRLAGPNTPTFAINFVSGIAAAATATVLTQPADVVRAQMQLNLGQQHSGKASPPARSLALAGAIFQRGGARALLTGFGPRVAKRTLQTALVWTLYEALVPQASALVHAVQKNMAGDGGKT